MWPLEKQQSQSFNSIFICNCIYIYINNYIYIYVYQSLYHIYNICAYTSTVSFISRYFALCLCRLCLPRASFFDNSEVGVGSWADDYWYIYNKYIYIYIYIIIYTILCIYIYIYILMVYTYSLQNHFWIHPPFRHIKISDCWLYKYIYIHSHWGVRHPVIQIYIYTYIYIYTHTHTHTYIYTHIIADDIHNKYILVAIWIQY